MRKKWVIQSFFGCVVLLADFFPVFAGDSLYGKVTGVKSADMVTFDYGAGRYDLRLVGIEVPREGPIAAKAKELVSNLVLGKSARMRFEGRTPNGEMLARLFTDDPAIGIKEVAVELVKAGLARRQKDYDFKYGELAAAEREARAARRGLWAAEQPK
jgi:endonuclease YncB( thermonuclease family)